MQRPGVRIPSAPQLHGCNSCASPVPLSHIGFGCCVSLSDPAPAPGRQWLRYLCPSNSTESAHPLTFTCPQPRQGGSADVGGTLTIEQHYPAVERRNTLRWRSRRRCLTDPYLLDIYDILTSGATRTIAPLATNLASSAISRVIPSSASDRAGGNDGRCEKQANQQRDRPSRVHDYSFH